MTTRTVQVPGISCGHCVATIERELAEMDGVQNVKADLASKSVEVGWDESATDWSAVASLLDEIGYPPSEAA